MKKFTKRQIIGMAAAAVLILAAAAAAVLIAGRSGKSYRSVRIVETGGRVIISREGIGDLEAAPNMNLVSGDYLYTDADSYVALMLDADKYVMLGESGGMQIAVEGDERNGRTSIFLEQGSVLNELQNPLGQDTVYEVVTPDAVMSVRGTVFEVERQEDGLVSLYVYEGTVELTLEEQEPVLYNAGEYMQFREGTPPEVLTDRAPVSGELMQEQLPGHSEEYSEQAENVEVKRNNSLTPLFCVNGTEFDLQEVTIGELISEAGIDVGTVSYSLAAMSGMGGEIDAFEGQGFSNGSMQLEMGDDGIQYAFYDTQMYVSASADGRTVDWLEYMPVTLEVCSPLKVEGIMVTDEITADASFVTFCGGVRLGMSKREVDGMLGRGVDVKYCRHELLEGWNEGWSEEDYRQNYVENTIESYYRSPEYTMVIEYNGADDDAAVYSILFYRNKEKKNIF